MSKLYLHIGMHKTGTTTFQNVCAEQREDLRTHGIVYHLDDTGSVNHSHFVHLLYQHRRDEVERLLRLSFEEGPRADVHVISGEDISYLQPSDFDWFVNILRRYFDAIHVVGVVRSPLSFMNSAGQQILREQDAKIDQLLDRIDTTPWYRFRFEKAVAAVGRDNCHFIEYTSGSLSVLAKLMGIPLDFSGRRDNLAMNLGMALLLNAMKPLPPDLTAAQALEVLAGSTIDLRPFAVPVEVVDRWESQIAEDLNWLASVWQVPEHFHHEPRPEVRLSDFAAPHILDELRRLFPD